MTRNAVGNEAELIEFGEPPESRGASANRRCHDLGPIAAKSMDRASGRAGFAGEPSNEGNQGIPAV